jgi:hypothetical protein
VFPGIDVATGSSALGMDQNIEPPDTQIAAGPTSLAEMVNDNLSVWSKAGARLALVDLNTFYNVPSGFSISDPRVVYDASSGRFLASAFALNTSDDSNLYLAVSNTSDPTGTWFHWLVRNTLGTVTDQPKIGYSDDKITISWAEFVPPPCQGQSQFFCFTGQMTTVVEKGDALAVPQNSSPHFATLGPDLTSFGIVPAQSLSSTSAQFMVYNNADPFNLVENQCPQAPNALYGSCPTIAILTITGTPIGGNVLMVQVDAPMADTTLPPNAVQPGTSTKLQTGDDRLLSAVWQNNMIWTSLTDGNLCSAVKPMTEPLGSCARVIEASTTSDTVQQVLQLGGSGDFFFYPSVSPDSSGDAMVVASRSNATMFPGIWITGFMAGPAAWSLPSLVRASTHYYDSATSCHGQNRWGDYAGAATDPADPTDVWVASEYAANVANPANTCVWGTEIGRLTYSAPTVTSVTASSGPRAGGTQVTIGGTDFVAGATTVYFGSAHATNVIVQNPDQLTAVTPYGNGVQPISAATVEGHGPLGALFTYLSRTEPGAASAQQGGAFAVATAPPVPPQATNPGRLGPPPPAHLAAGAPSPAGPIPTAVMAPLWLSLQQAVLRLLHFLE